MRWSQMVLAGLCALLAVGGGCADAPRESSREAAPRQARQQLSTLAPRQVRDINLATALELGGSGAGGVWPTSLPKLGDSFFFGTSDDLHGGELWKSDGTEAGSVMVKDIYPGARSSSVSSLTVLNGVVYFTASHPESGYELWRSDGTEAGTFLVKDVLPGVNSGLDINDGLRVHRGQLFFLARVSAGSSTKRLWKSDGTQAGTVLVPGLPDQVVGERGLPSLGDFLYFYGQDALHGAELWRTDGTNTSLVADIAPGPASIHLESLTRAGDFIYFSAQPQDGTTSLWRTDGTAAGTFALRSTIPFFLTAFQGVLYFVSLGGGDLWRSDGTVQGTYAVQPRLNAWMLMATEEALWFHADDRVHGSELWTSDGTAAGTRMVKDISPGSFGPQPYARCGVGKVVYFTVTTAAFGNELWRSDGTEAGTHIVKDIYPGSQGSNPFGKACTPEGIFFYADDGVHGSNLWRSDGTEEGTFFIKDFRRPPGSSNPKHFTDVGGTVFFQATDGLHGQELWKTDGTRAGTALVKDLRPGSDSSGPDMLTAVGSKLAFVTYDGVSGRELWWSDGTAAGTLQPRDIRPGTNSPDIREPTPMGGVLYFRADDGVNGAELWRSDGTPEGTFLLKDLRPGSTGSFPSMLVARGNTLFFFANDGVSGAELWTSDGTPEGTVLVKDIQPGSSSSFLNVTNWPMRMVVLNGVAYFAANTSVSGLELWRSDGTSEGTFLVKDIHPGSPGSTPTSLTVVGNLLYFSAGDATTREELWRSDGTPEGTFLVKDIHPTSASTPRDFTAAGGLVYFLADDGSTGVELYRTDGTPGGTFLLKDIRTGYNTSSNPGQLRELDGMLYFRATPGLDFEGARLWRTDGTEAGTVIVPEFMDNGLVLGPDDMLRVGTSLYLAASDTLSGFELWRLAPSSDPQDPPDTQAPVLTCPAPVTVEATSAQGRAVGSFSARATDDVSAPAFTYQPSNGSLFPVGTTEVLVTATDRAGNSSTCTFPVTVRDSVAPRVSCPAPVTAEATGESGAQVTYPEATASDSISAASLAYSLASGSTFPLGTTDVRVTATDTSGNAATCTFAVTVRDTTAPRVGCPEPVTAEAESATGANVLFSVAAPVDAVTRSPAVSLSHAPGSRFPLGTTTVSLTATDEAQNAASCTFSVTVRDSTVPTVTCPAPMTAEATRETGAEVLFPDATASDTVSAASLSYHPASGSTLALGTTDVRVTATDGAGNEASCTFAVTVRDTTAPRVGCPGPLTAEAESATGANVVFSSAAPVDEVTRFPAFSATHAPGSRFPLGTTTVTQTATDEANNSASCSFTVTVRDTTAPTLTCPESVTVSAKREEGAEVDYAAATASDAVTAALEVSYSHTSGSLFPKGTTRVTASTVDGAGLRAECAFDVTVREPSTAVTAVATLGCSASGAMGGNPSLPLWLLLGAGALWSRRRHPAVPPRSVR